MEYSNKIPPALLREVCTRFGTVGQTQQCNKKPFFQIYEYNINVMKTQNVLCLQSIIKEPLQSPLITVMADQLPL